MIIIKRDENGYEEARVGRVFNHRRPDRYPIECAKDVMMWWQQIHSTVSLNIELVLGYLTNNKETLNKNEFKQH